MVGGRERESADTHEEEKRLEGEPRAWNDESFLLKYFFDEEYGMGIRRESREWIYLHIFNLD